MNYILQQLKQKSTYAGILSLLSAFGLVVDPEQFAAIAAAVIAIVGVYETFRKEK